MSVIETKELMDEFFEKKYPKNKAKIQSQIDRPEVYEYEKKIGKSLVDMNVDELFDMILTFHNNRSKGNESYSINYTSYTQMASYFRGLFNYYIDNYEIIRNPFNDSRMRGTEAAKRLAKSKKPFRKEDVESVIMQIRDNYDVIKANYLECIILLYYNGFAKAAEIAMLSEDMIDFKNKTVALPGRTIQLTDRCFELLIYVHSLKDIPGVKGNFVAVSWRGNYFKYIIYPREAPDFDNRTLLQITGMINRRIFADVKKKFDVEIGYRLLYLLGFYEKMVDDYGEERVTEMIVSLRVSEDIEDLLKSAREYGMAVDNVTVLKRSLRPFLRG